MSSVENTRIAQLAKPKQLVEGFLADRRTVYWTEPITKNEIQVSDRQKQLAEPKQPHRHYQGDRPSPIWHVSKKTLQANVTNRVSSLSKPKEPHVDWRKDKPIRSVINRTALTVEPTERVIELSRPKGADPRYINPTISETKLDILHQLDERLLKRNAEETLPDWIDRLSQAKGIPRGYEEDRPVRWYIAESTKTASISSRVEELSKIRRTGKRGDEISNDVDDPYSVSRPAMKATASDRIESLAKPVGRKVRSKMVKKSNK